MSQLPVLTHPTVLLRDGHTIPQIGFGVWQVPNEDVHAAVREALKAGYRLIDTAQGYHNEEGVGEAIQTSGIARDEIFVTTKLRNGGHGRDDALASFEQSMKKLRLDVLDMFLIHWPVPKQNLYVDAWKAMIELQQQGRVKSIGVSNFNADHLERIIGETGVTPAVNQIELHPGYQQRDARAFHQRHKIAIESYSPLGSGHWLDDPAIHAIARKHGKSPAQTIIRWHLEQGLIVIPKSVTPARIWENFDVLDFSLDGDDMAEIAGLDDPKRGKVGSDPATADFRF